MIRNLISSAAAASAALLTLSACGSQAPDDDAATAQNQQYQTAARAARITELPPAIQVSRTYRCGESIYYVDFYTNNTAQLRTEQTGPATTLTAEGGNPPFVAEGYSIGANASETRIQVPGKSAQSCRSRA